MNVLQIHPLDTVAVALETISKGDRLPDGVSAAETVSQGHKLALRKIRAGDDIIKYSCPIGHATQDIEAGEWVHSHNLMTNLRDIISYAYHPDYRPLTLQSIKSFAGFLRPDGRAATRNEIWILPTVGCVNGVAQKLAHENRHLMHGGIEGLYAFPHPFGCSQLGDDHENTKRILAALADHPNAGGVLILGLGCENNRMEQFQHALRTWDPDRVKFLVCQDTADELTEGSRMLHEIAAYAGQFRRQALSADKLIVGLKCGGSDGLSGITANPVVGRFSDLLLCEGGSAILTEVPEMFGAQGLLFNRCINQDIFNKAVSMIQDFKQYFLSNGQNIYENPSPGNKDGGITTLEEKSCGCVQKGGCAPISDVLAYGDRVRGRGLSLLSGPGNDLVSTTALTAAGAHLILFTTGRGTPFGAPVPTLKIASNTALFETKSGWIDFNAGSTLQGETIEEAGQRLLNTVLQIAGGEQTKAEKHGYREISLWKNGVVL